VSGLAPTASFVTIESDPARSDAAATLLASYPNARVLRGHWRDILAYGPFDLLFADTPAKREEPETVLDALAPGGLIVLDDLTPEEYWPPEWRGRPDPVREVWLNDPRLSAAELLLTPTACAILATRLV